MKKIRLLYSCLALYLALVLVQHLLIIAFTYPALRHQQSQDAITYARMSARAVAEAYDRYYASGYYKFRELVGDVLRMNPHLRRLYLIDVEGRVLFDSREFESGVRAAPGRVESQEILAAVKGLDLACWLMKDEDGAARLDIVVPYLEEWGQHRVSVRYQIDYHPWSRPGFGLWRRLLIAGLLSLALGGLAIYVLVGRWAAGGQPGTEAE